MKTENPGKQTGRDVEAFIGLLITFRLSVEFYSGLFTEPLSKYQILGNFPYKSADS